MQTSHNAIDIHPASVRHEAHQRPVIANIVRDVISSAFDSQMTTEKQNARYQLFLRWLMECTEVSVVLLARPWPPQCIWPVSKLLVHNALVFYQYIMHKVATDASGLFHVDPEQYPTATSTYIVYHTLHSLGMKERFRGPPQTDPGPLEYLYYKMWSFENDKSFQQACVRNAKCDVTDFKKGRNLDRIDTEVRLMLAKFK